MKDHEVIVLTLKTTGDNNLNYSFIFIFYGKSFPHLEKGLHLIILQNHLIHHFKNQYFCIDNFVYSEQVGEYIQYQTGYLSFHHIEGSGEKFFG